MLFMGEEYGAAQPFYYFTSHADEKLADAVRTGRRKEFSRFPEFADPEALDALPDPNSFSTFMASIPEPVAPEEDATAGQWMGWCYRLLLIRREAITPYLPGAVALDAQAIGPAAVYARWRLNNGTVLCITVNLGKEAVTDSTDTTLDALATLAGADVLFDSVGLLDSLAGGVFPPHSILVIREAARGLAVRKNKRPAITTRPSISWRCWPASRSTGSMPTTSRKRCRRHRYAPSWLPWACPATVTAKPMKAVRDCKRSTARRHCHL